jgi:hypothetical protein
MLNSEGDFSDLAAACVPELIDVSLESLLEDSQLIIDTIEKTIAQEENNTFQQSINSVEIGTFIFYVAPTHSRGLTENDESFAKELLVAARSRILVHFCWGLLNIFTENYSSLILI